MKQHLTLTIAEGETVELESQVTRLTAHDRITIEAVERASQAGASPTNQVRLTIERDGYTAGDDAGD